MIIKDVKLILLSPGLAFGLAGLVTSVMAVRSVSFMTTLLGAAATAGGLGSLVACAKLFIVCTQYADGLTKLTKTKKEELDFLNSKIKYMKSNIDEYQTLKTLYEKD